MAAPTLLRRLAVPLVLACLVVAAPAPAAAVDVIPAQQTGERLPEPTITAIVGDVDGDGIRELIRLGPLAGDLTHVGVEVVSADGDGRLTRHGMAPFRRLAGVEEQLEGSAVPDERGMVAARINEPARLLIWRVRGAERVLVTAIGTTENPRACCLTLGEVGLDARGRTSITERAAIPESASYILAADLDADGTDELVISEPATLSAPGRTPIYVLRWIDGQFRRVEGTVGAPTERLFDGSLFSFGDSNGRPGDEVGLRSLGPAQGVTIFHRISMDGAGTLRLDRARSRFSWPLLPVSTADGGRLFATNSEGGSAVVAWPAGGDRLVVERRFDGGGNPVAVLGSGTGARLMQLFGDDVEQLTDRMASLRVTRASSRASVLSSRDRNAFVGPMPGGLRGSDALVFGGWLMTSLPSGAEAERAIIERPIAALAATTPIGAFGPGDIVLGLCEGTIDSTREGGQLQAPAGPRPGVGLSTPRASTVLSPEDDDGRYEPALSGGVLSAAPNAQVLLTQDGVSAHVVAPAGSRILVSDNAGARAPMFVPPSGSTQVALPVGETQTVIGLVVITPSGHGYAASWIVRVQDSPPTLEAATPSSSFGFAVPIRGRTDPGVSVTVDGQVATVAPDGSFALDVGVGFVPREVEIRAVDPVGNVATQRLSVVGPIDYRQLPWIPIVAALTVVAGAILYVRVPRPSPAPQRPSDDDAALEEIE